MTTLTTRRDPGDPPTLDAADEAVEGKGYKLTKHRFWGKTAEDAFARAELWALTVLIGSYASSYAVHYDARRQEYCLVVHLVTYTEARHKRPLQLIRCVEPERLESGWADDLQGVLREAPNAR